MAADENDSGGRARRQISARDARDLRPGQTIWDAVVVGFCIRRQRGPHASYGLAYRTQTGRKRFLTIGRHGSPWTPAEARREARRLLGLVAAGGDPMADREARTGSPVTVGEFCDRWLAESAAGRLLTRQRRPKKASTIETDRSRIASHIKPLIGAIPVAAVNRQDVERLMHAVMEGRTAKRIKLNKKHALSNIRGGTGAAARTLGMFGAIMSYAVRCGVRPDNPCVDVVRPADGQRDRRLSDNEYAALGQALIAAGDDDHRHGHALVVIRFLCITGWRRGEVLNLKWSEIDLDRRTARLADTKTGASMRPLATTACMILRAMPKGEFVFQAISGDMPMADIVRPWSKVMKLAGLADVTPHTLRHSFASVAADLNYGDATIAGLLGHKGHSITRRYIHSADAVLLAAADAVAQEIERRMTPQTAAMTVLPDAVMG